MKRLLILVAILAIIALGSIQATGNSAPTASAAPSLSVCPEEGQWVMATHLGPAGTPTGQALATCPKQIESAWTLTKDGWKGYRNDPNIPSAAQDLKTLDQYQPVFIRGYKKPVPLPYPACTTDVPLPTVSPSSRVYEGYWGGSNAAPSRLVIESIESNKAVVVYAVTLRDANSETRQWVRPPGGANVLADGAIQWGTGVIFTFRPAGENSFEGERVQGQVVSKVTMTRCSLPQ